MGLNPTRGKDYVNFYSLSGVMCRYRALDGLTHHVQGVRQIFVRLIILEVDFE
jgi:hypothetical protein